MIRHRLGMSQAELANSLGVHWVTVSRWETGRVEPRNEHLRQLAELLLDEALAHVRELLAGGDLPLTEPAPHVLAYTPSARGAIADYVARSLDAGYAVCFVSCPAKGGKSIAELWGLPPEVVSHPGFRFVSTRDAFFKDGRYNLSQMNYLGRRLEEEILGSGYRHIRWIDDVSDLLAHGVSWEEIVVMEYNADSVFRSQRVSEGLSIYSLPDRFAHPGEVCVLCRHPWLLASHGFVQNPYYDDLLLCWARGNLKWEYYRARADAGQGKGVPGSA